MHLRCFCVILNFSYLARCQLLKFVLDYFTWLLLSFHYLSCCLKNTLLLSFIQVGSLVFANLDFWILSIIIDLFLFICNNIIWLCNNTCDVLFLLQWISADSWVMLICAVSVSETWAYKGNSFDFTCISFMDSVGLYFWIPLGMYCIVV